MPRPTRIRLITVLAVSALALSACATTPSPVETVEHEAAHWSYVGETGPAHWAALESDFATCATGVEQSPIDLDSAESTIADRSALVTEFVDGSDEATDNGHTVQLAVEPGSETIFEGTSYALLQAHYHAPSEHTIDGEYAPVEFHFVHADADDNLLVIGVLVTVGASNAAWQPFIDAVASGALDTAATDLVIDDTVLLPTTESGGYYSYRGSLTTPPCSEGVQWIVLDTPLMLGSEQVDALTTAYEGNNRPIQDLGDREIDLNN